MWCGGLALLALCAGCQGRQANPVSMVQPGDDELTCAQLTGEIKGNNVQIRHLSGKDEEVEVGNAIAVVVFPFGIDLSSKEQIEMRALLDRNRQLDRIRKTRDCAA